MPSHHPTPLSLRPTPLSLRPTPLSLRPMPLALRLVIIAAVLDIAGTGDARAQVPPPPPPPVVTAPSPGAPAVPVPVSVPVPAVAGPITDLAQGQSHSSTKASLQLGGYVEAFYQWNFNNPSNGITNYRAFDNRHNSLTISNAVLDALGTLGPVTAHLAVQFGHTPESYYLAEPFAKGTNIAGASGANVWKYLQQANVAWKAPVGRGLLFEVGIFLSPIGPEGVAIKDQWNWSRSNLFIGLPYYHTGLRVTYPFTDRVSLSAQIYNGWNSVVDNNKEKSGALQFTCNLPDKLTLNLIYFVGVERNQDYCGSPDCGSRPWRHLFDAYVAWYPRPWLALLVHADAGFEPNAFGTSAWAAGAAYARFQPIGWLYLVARADYFYEHHPGPTPAARLGTSIFFPVDWVSSATLTADFRPADNLSLRIEYRHDHAANPLYFVGDVIANVQTGDYIPNASSQNTLTAGATAWF